MSRILRARRLLTEQGWLDDHQLRFENDVIVALEPIPRVFSLATPSCCVPHISIFMSTAAQA